MNEYTSVSIIGIDSHPDMFCNHIGGSPIPTDRIQFCWLLGPAEGVPQPLLWQERVHDHPEVPVVLSGRSNLLKVDGGIQRMGAGEADHGGQQEA